MRRLILLSLVMTALLMGDINSAEAYIGPGVGIAAIGTVLGLLAAIFLAILGLVWFPIKRILRQRKASKEARGERPSA